MGRCLFASFAPLCEIHYQFLLHWKALGRSWNTWGITAWWISHAGPNCGVQIQPPAKQNSPCSQWLGRGWDLQGKMLSWESSPFTAAAMAPTAGISRFSNCSKDGYRHSSWWTGEKTGILASLRRHLAAHLAQWSSWITSPDLGLVAVNTWTKNSSETQWKVKTKNWTGLVMHGKYSHPQGLLHSRGRGHEPSLRRHWPQRAFHTPLSGDIKPNVPLLRGRTKQKMHSHCNPGRQKRIKYCDFSSLFVCYLCWAWMFSISQSSHLAVYNDQSPDEWSLCF